MNSKEDPSRRYKDHLFGRNSTRESLLPLPGIRMPSADEKLADARDAIAWHAAELEYAETQLGQIKADYARLQVKTRELHDAYRAASSNWETNYGQSSDRLDRAIRKIHDEDSLDSKPRRAVQKLVIAEHKARIKYEQARRSYLDSRLALVTTCTALSDAMHDLSNARRHVDEANERLATLS